MKLNFQNLQEILSETEESYVIGQKAIPLKWNSLSKIAKYAGIDLPSTRKTLEFHDLISPISFYTCIYSKVKWETIPGPALVERNEKGQIHSLDGPAVIWADKGFFIYEYWVDGLPVSREKRKFVSREDIAWASTFKRNQNFYFTTEEDREKERKYNDLCLEYFVKDSRSPEPRGVNPRMCYLTTARNSFTYMNEDLYSLFRFLEAYNDSKHLCPNNQMLVLSMNSFMDKLGCREKALSYGWTLPNKYSDNTIGTNRSITGEY